jgi:hypothetical protein
VIAQRQELAGIFKILNEAYGTPRQVHARREQQQRVSGVIKSIQQGI